MGVYVCVCTGVIWALGCACLCVYVRVCTHGHEAWPHDPGPGPSGELHSPLPEKLSLVTGSILGSLAFLLLAALSVLAVVFRR